MSHTEAILAVRPTKSIYREGDTVLKVFDQHFSKSDVLNEALNQARVEETGLEIPKILEILKLDGNWAIRLEYIPGKTLQQLMDENPDKLEEYLDFFINLQLKVLSKKAPLLNPIREKMIRKIAQSDLEPATKYDLHTRIMGMPLRQKVCHGDFNPSNIVITDAGIPYVLDWSHATQGNAGADAAQTYILFRLAGKDALANRYLDLFCQKADRRRTYVQSWIPIMAAAHSLTCEGKDHELLIRWANVLQYE